VLHASTVSELSRSTNLPKAASVGISTSGRAAVLGFSEVHELLFQLS
jgi:hypothetical protein